MGAGDLWAADAVTDTAQEVVSAKVEDLLHVASRGGLRGAGSATTARRERRTELRKTKGRTSSSSELLEVTSSETEPELLRDRGILVRLSYTLQPGGGAAPLAHHLCTIIVIAATGGIFGMKAVISRKKTENSDFAVRSARRLHRGHGGGSTCSPRRRPVWVRSAGSSPATAGPLARQGLTSLSQADVGRVCS
jgi:hypothetical protein